MSLPINASLQPSHAPATQSQHAPVLAATSLTFLKPRFKRTLRPIAAQLARAGITANQVTTISLVGSVGVGALLYLVPTCPRLFAILPVWLLARTACATIDGTLAVEFGQKSRLGGILNEASDIASDIAPFLPLASVPPFSTTAIASLICFIVLTELAGIAGPIFGNDRRLEGPLGKADRSIVLSLMGVAIAIFGQLPQSRNHIRTRLLSRIDRDDLEPSSLCAQRSRKRKSPCRFLGAHSAPASIFGILADTAPTLNLRTSVGVHPSRAGAIVGSTLELHVES
jgi:CDP-diacylglycerol--glycerol-3-phosphate 3-phosphatidyltransferase